MKLNLTLSQSGLILVGLPVTFGLAFVLVLSIMLKQSETEAYREAHAKEVLLHANHFNTLCFEIAEAMIGYARQETPRLAKVVTEKRSQILHHVEALKRLCKDTPSQARLVAAVEMLIDQMSAYWDGIQRKDGIRPRPRELDEIAQLIAQVYQDLISEMASLIMEESRFAKLQGDDASDWRARVKSILIVTVIINIIMALGVAVFFTHGIVGRLYVLTDNIQRFAANRTLNPALEGVDEISRIDRHFHSMAAALTEANRKQRAIIEKARDVICTVGEDGRFIQTNPACSRLWWYQPDELSGQNLAEILLRQDVQPAQEFLKQVKECETSDFLETRVVRKDGKVLDNCWSVHWFNQDRVYFCVAHDITEQKRLEDARRDFYSMLTHDLRTPLTALAGYLKLLSAGVFGPLPEPAEKEIAAGELKVEMVLGLVNEFLDMERFSAGKVELTLSDIPLEQIFLQARDATELLARPSAILLAFDETDLLIRADRHRLLQVVVSLIASAIKASPAGGTVKVTVSHKNDFAEVSVIDQGKSIPEELRQKIFDRFQQREIEGATSRKSSRLGLALCKMLIDAHGGKIGYACDGEQGSRFWFRLQTITGS